MPALNEIKFRRDSATDWTTTNPILRAAEPGYEEDTGKVKIGDGVTEWVDLDYWSGGGDGTLTAADITDFGTAVAAATVLKADLVGGKVPAAQLPAIAITEFLGTVANQAGMLALVGGQVGDWCIRTDTGTSWFITGTPTTDIASWTELAGGSVAGVTTVNSRSGAVTLTKTDVGLANADNTADTAKPVSTAQAAANAVVAGAAAQKSANLSDLANAATARTNLGLGNVNNTSDVNKPISAATQTALNGKAPIIHTHDDGGGVFTGSVDWATQVTGKPVIPSTASQVGAIPTSDRGAANGVASLDATTKVPIAQIPVGTSSTTVMAGNATPALTIAQLPAGSTLTVTAVAGVYPSRPTARTDVIVRWRGTSAPANGGTGSVADVDEWVAT